MIQIKPGMRLKSAICATEVMLVKATIADVELCCGGQALVEITTEGNSGGAIAAEFTGGTQVGKRYVNQAETVELLCTKAGEGALSAGDEVLGLKESKALPSSD
jgi:ABC-type thiamine transport system substrate-binding protein